MRDIAEGVGLTERATQGILSDLAAAGYIEVTRVGRRNAYRLHPEAHMRHRNESDHTIGGTVGGLHAGVVVTPERLTGWFPGYSWPALVPTQRCRQLLLDGTGGAVVVDPAWYPDELGALADDVQALGAVCVGGVATRALRPRSLAPGARIGSPMVQFCHSCCLRQRNSAVGLLAPAGEFLPPELLDLAGRDLSAIPATTSHGTDRRRWRWSTMPMPSGIWRCSCPTRASCWSETCSAMSNSRCPTMTM